MKNYRKHILSFITSFMLLTSGTTLSVSAQTTDDELDENVQSEEVLEAESTTVEEPEEDIIEDEEVALEIETTTDESEKMDTDYVTGDNSEEEMTPEDMKKSEKEDSEKTEDVEEVSETEEPSLDELENKNSSEEDVEEDSENELATEGEEESEEVEKSEKAEEPKVLEGFKGSAVNAVAQTMSLNLPIQELNNYSEFRTVAYHATVTGSDGNLYNMPVELEGSTSLSSVSSHKNKAIIVRKEGAYAGRTWILAESNGEYLGWLLKQKITPAYETVTSEETVAYNGLLQTNGRYQIFNRPAYTEGNYQVSDSSNYTGESIVVRGEIQTDYNQPRVWTLIEANGNLIGWINSNALTPVYNEVLDEKTVAYNGSVNTNGRYQIFSRPAYTEGNRQVANSSDFTGEDVIVRGEIKTDYYGGTTWSLIESNGKEIGWINSSGVTPDYDTVGDEKIVAYDGTVNTNGRYQIFSRPAYTEGNYQVADSSNLYGDNIVIRKKIDTRDNRTWALIEANGQELGWINNQAIIESYDQVLSSRNLDHPRIIRNLTGRYQLFSAPAYTEGNYQVDNILDYAGQTGMITQERVTNRAVWHLLSVNGKRLGWINDKALRKPRIYVDAGHGGNDSGASFAGVHEKNLNLRTSNYLKEQLESTGYYNVIMSRDTDVFVELEDRSGDANNRKPDIFVSVHYNSMGGSGGARGIETFIHHTVPSGFGQEANHSKFKTNDPRIKESLDLAKLVHSNLIKDTGMRDRGVKGNNYHVVRETNMPAILLELGFIDNSAERNLVNNSSYQRRAAGAVVKGINQYFKQ